MRQMKDSGVKWIENIPSDWTIVPLKWIVKFGKGLPITKDNLVEQGVPVVSYGQIHSKTNSGTHLGKDLMRFVNEKYLQSNPSSLGKKGDIFFADTSEDYAGVGNAVLVDGDEPVFAGYHTVIVRPIDLLYSKYLAYLFLTDAWRSQLCSRVSGIKVFSVTQGLLKETTVILPPTEKIATMTDYLDRKCAEIDAIIAKQQHIIEKLKEYKLSVITEAVTKGLDPNVPMKDSGVEWIGMVPEEWRISRIKYICEFNPGTKKANHDVVSYAPMECVKDGYLIKKEIRHDGISTGLTSFEEGDIIMAKVTPCFENGNIAIAKDLVNKFGVGSSELFIFRAKKVNTQWLFYFLRNSIFKKLAEATMTGTGGLKRVSPSFIRDFSLALPPEKEQRRIIEYLDKKCMEIDRVIKYKQSAVEKLGQYKKSLIYEVVTGKMEV